MHQGLAPRQGVFCFLKLTPVSASESNTSVHPDAPSASCDPNRAAATQGDARQQACFIDKLARRFAVRSKTKSARKRGAASGNEASSLPPTR
jgi:hypothetical protein